MVRRTFAAAAVAAALATLRPTRARTRLKVSSQTGRFRIYDDVVDGDEDDAGIIVVLSALKEVDANGTEVGRHSVANFSRQVFAVRSPQRNVLLGTAVADRVDFTTVVGSLGTKVGRLTVETYLITSGGVLEDGSDEWNLTAGDLKWSVRLSEWSWCGCRQGQQVEVGAFVDLKITVSGLGQARAMGTGSDVDLGGGVNMVLTKQVTLDGNATTMPAGYPRVSFDGTRALLLLRFPKFAKEALFDPTITYSAAAVDEREDSAGGGSVSNGSDAVVFSGDADSGVVGGGNGSRWDKPGALVVSTSRTHGAALLVLAVALTASSCAA